MSLKEMCLQLPLEARTELCKFLQESIMDEKRTGYPMGRPAILKKIMAEIMMVPELPLKSRKTQYTWARNMIAYQLSMEGMTDAAIGISLEKDRSSVYYMRHRVDEALANQWQYQDVIYIWKQFKEKIDHDILERTTENLISLGGEFPDCCQGEMGEESGEDCPPGDL